MGHDEGERDAGARPERGGRGGPDSRFLDLEISRVLHDDACRAARAALSKLLADRIAERLAERLGDRLDALADLAAADLLADLEANVAIERRIAERSEQKEAHLDRLRAILRGDDEG